MSLVYKRYPMLKYSKFELLEFYANTKESSMECKEFEKMIPAYFAGRLDEREAKVFIGHIESCKECKEELIIQYLVTEGLQRLEEGGPFDIQKELQEKLDQSVHGLRMRKKCRRFVYAVEGLVILLLMGASVYFVLL